MGPDYGEDWVPKIRVPKGNTRTRTKFWVWVGLGLCLNSMGIFGLGTHKVQKGMGNLKYLLPSDEGILKFLSNSIEIWSRDQFFHKNQLCYIARFKILLK